MFTRILTFAALVLGVAGAAAAEHRVLVIGDKTLSVVAADGKTEWEMPWPGIHDIHVLPNGNLVFGNCHAGPGQPLLIEIDRETKKVLWTFDHFDTLGNSVTNSVLMDLAGQTIR